MPLRALMFACSGRTGQKHADENEFRSHESATARRPEHLPKHASVWWWPSWILPRSLTGRGLFPFLNSGCMSLGPGYQNQGLPYVACDKRWVPNRKSGCPRWRLTNNSGGMPSNTETFFRSRREGGLGGYEVELPSSSLRSSVHAPCLSAPDMFIAHREWVCPARDS